MVDKPFRRRLSREESREQTRARLLQSAQELFSVKGLEGTSIDEISEHAGYSRGAFYSNFSGKVEMMRLLIEDGFTGDVQSVRSVPGSIPTRDLAAGFGQMARRFYEDKSNLLWMLEFQLSVVRHPELSVAYTQQYDKLRQAVADLIQTHLENNGVRDADGFRRFADAFIVILSGLGLQKIIHGDTIPDSRFEEAFLALVFGMQNV